MMKYVTIAMVLATPAAAQEKTFNFSGITNIEVRSGITVNVTHGDEISITGSAISGDVDQFNIRKFGSWLAVNRNMRWFIFPYGRQDDLVLNVTLPDARAFKAYDDAEINASGFGGETFRAEALEGGTIRLNDFNFAETSLYATEKGDLSIDGQCETVAAEAIISANIDAFGLDCDLGTVSTRGGAVVSLSPDTQIVDELPELAAE